MVFIDTYVLMTTHATAPPTEMIKKLGDVFKTKALNLFFYKKNKLACLLSEGSEEREEADKKNDTFFVKRML